MNRWCITVLFFGLVVVAAVLGAPKETSFEERVKILKNIDIETVLKNERILLGLIDCVETNKRCTKEGRALKESWKEGLDKGCEQCDESEKRKIKKIAKYLYTEKRPLYDRLVDTFDKDGKYREKYQSYMDEILKDTTL